MILSTWNVFVLFHEISTTLGTFYQTFILFSMRYAITFATSYRLPISLYFFATIETSPFGSFGLRFRNYYFFLFLYAFAIAFSRTKNISHILEDKCIMAKFAFLSCYGLATTSFCALFHSIDSFGITCPIHSGTF